MPLLTDIDARAAVKGYRDPLGAQAIWTLLGQHVVGGLTTNTTSVRDFVVLLFGHWLIEKRDAVGSKEEAPAVLVGRKQRTRDTRFVLGRSKDVRWNAERQHGCCRFKAVILPSKGSRWDAIEAGTAYCDEPETLRGDPRGPLVALVTPAAADPRPKCRKPRPSNDGSSRPQAGSRTPQTEP